MHPSSTPLTKLRINTYEDPFLQHQYVCLGHKGISGMSLEILFKIAQAFQINVGQLVRLRVVDYKNCNAHLTSHYKRLELLNHTKRTSQNKTRTN